MSYKIFTDSTANLTNEIIEKFDLEVISLDYIDENGNIFKSYEKGVTPDMKSFYDAMRNKKCFTTSCINEQTFIDSFTPVLSAETDILYIGFGSALSVTASQAASAVTTLKKVFPKRRIYAVDSLCASMGLGLLVYNACLMKEQGKSIDEVFSAVESQKHRICHLFTVDDLYFLYKGGRLSSTSYVIANIINLKPILRCDEKGALTAYGKVLGRKKALNSLISKLVETIVEPENQTLFISHGDCLEDVEYVIRKLNEKIKVKDIVVNYIDSVIGSHSGPGTLAIFYEANNREV